MISKFNGMIQTLEMRSTSSIKKLTGVSKTTISQAKAKLDAAMTKYKKQRELVKISKSQTKKGAGILLAESKSDSSGSNRQKTKMLESKLKFKQQEAVAKQKLKNEIAK